MGRNNNSWVDAVKKAFGSPTKHIYTIKSTTLIRNQQQQEESEYININHDYKKKKKKKKKIIKGIIRWINFMNTSSLHSKETTTTILLHHHHGESNILLSAPTIMPATNSVSQAAAAAYSDNNSVHDDAVVTISTAAAAASALGLSASPSYEKHKAAAAALVIQASFRGYLARRAVEALRGVVKLQALVRGHNVRTRAKMTLKCIKSLLRVQARVCHQRRTNQQLLLLNQPIRTTTFLHDHHHHHSPSINYHHTPGGEEEEEEEEEGMTASDEYYWDEYRIDQDIQALMLQKTQVTPKKDHLIPPHAATSFIHRHQFYGSNNQNQRHHEQDLEWDRKFQFRDHPGPGVVKIDTTTCHRRQPCRSFSPSSCQQTTYHHKYQQDRLINDSNPFSSPPLILHHKSQHDQSPHASRLQQLSSVSPARCYKTHENKSPSPRCYQRQERSLSSSNTGNKPSYMSATTSAMARIRPQITTTTPTPRQRITITDGGGGDQKKPTSARKRLSFFNLSQKQHNYNAAEISDSTEIERSRVQRRLSLSSSCCKQRIEGEISDGDQERIRYCRFN